MNFIPKIEIILEYDKILKKQLLDSPFLEEIDTINRLMKYSLTYEQIDQTMEELIQDRWTQYSNEKKKQLYLNAEEVNKKRTKNPLMQYFDLTIKKIELYPNKNESMLKIVLEDAKIELSKDKIISSREFRTLYYLESQGTLLPDLPQNVWAKLLTLWTKKYGKVIIKQEVTEDELISEKIINEIESFTITTDIKKCLNYGRVCLKDDIVLVPSNAIELINQKNKWNLKLTKISFMLENKLAGKSEPKRIGRKLIRFWKFKKEALNLEYNEVIENEND